MFYAGCQFLSERRKACWDTSWSLRSSKCSGEPSETFCNRIGWLSCLFYSWLKKSVTGLNFFLVSNAINLSPNCLIFQFLLKKFHGKYRAREQKLPNNTTCIHLLWSANNWYVVNVGFDNIWMLSDSLRQVLAEKFGEKSKKLRFSASSSPLGPGNVLVDILETQKPNEKYRCRRQNIPNFIGTFWISKHIENWSSSWFFFGTN